MVFEDLVGYISQNGVQRSIKPVFKTDDFALYNDDSLEVMSRFPDNYVDMIFADPPYMLSNDGFTCQNGRMVPVNKGKWDKSKGFDEDFSLHETWIKECRRVLKPEGTISIAELTTAFTNAVFLLQKLNFHLLNDIGLVQTKRCSKSSSGSLPLHTKQFCGHAKTKKQNTILTMRQ